jgi:rhodanese-related sulfurtransferase
MVAYVVVAVVVLFLAFTILRMRPDITGPEARDMVASGAKLLDVRTTMEFASGSLPKARNIPVGELGSRVAELGNKEKPIVVFCQTGARSATAKRVLKTAGFATVRNLGALSRW